jgi:2-amino-4-hydroxy-6-hydroxymethyldihydropteridine diphosphokinase
VTLACIGLGANLGDAAQTLRGAFEAMAALPLTTLRARSQLYSTPAWGNEDQPAFINAAAVLETGLEATALLEGLLRIERDFGRVRDVAVHWGPRTLDLDLLLYGEAVIDLPQLKVPHPYLHERGFALLPLAEVAPEAVIPGHGRVRDAAMRIEACGIAPIGG